MLTIPRSLARRVRAVFKRAFGGSRRDELHVRLCATPGALCIRAVSHDVAVEHRLAGDFQPCEIIVPLDLLADCEAKSEDLVSFETTDDSRVVARWDDRGIPQQRAVQQPVKLPEFPPPSSGETATNEPGLLKALVDAGATTDIESSRFALGCIDVRGGTGRIAATDGRQLFVHNGFSFPWQGDVLVPASKVFASPELPANQPVIVGQAGDWAMFAVGPWTIWLRINKDGRFPKIDDMIRPPVSARSRLQLTASDAEFATDVLKRLPLDVAGGRPVTLDLNGEAIVRTRPESTEVPTELVLCGSTVAGDPIRLVTSAVYLRRALTLGFNKVDLFGPEASLQASDDRRHYIWMPFSAEGAVQPHAESHRILSSNNASPASSCHLRRVTPKSRVSTENSNPIPNPRVVSPMPETKTESNASPIEQAVALRSSLRESLVKTNELLRALKRQRQRSRHVESTLAALKQLQKVA